MAEVLTDIADGVAVVTLDAPDRRNALTLPMVDEIAAALDAARGRPRRSAPSSSPAPRRPSARAPTCPTSGRASARACCTSTRGSSASAGRPLPSIAAVNGAAVGAGVNLALVCDVIVAGASARFDTRFLQLGIHPGGGHTWMLQRRVGPQAAAAMVLFGRVLDGPAAAEAGLAWACVPDDELLATCREMAAVAAAAAPRELVSRIRGTMRDVRAIDDHDAAVERELEPQVWSINQPAFQEKLAAMQRRISSRD